jgi:ferrochelatase
MLYSREIERKLKAYYYALHKGSSAEPPLLRMAYRYSEPGIQTTLSLFRDHEVSDLTVLPLFPQQAFATTESVRDELENALSALRWQPRVRFINSYYNHECYIEALANTIKLALGQDVEEDAYNVPVAASEQYTVPYQQDIPTDTHLFFSFHSTPCRDYANGDPYYDQALATAAAAANAAALPNWSWHLAFQSRFKDAQKWIGPFLDEELLHLLERGARKFFVIAPGFAVDCLETLYEIEVLANEGLRRTAAAAGINPDTIGFTYIPALNASDTHIGLIAELLA